MHEVRESYPRTKDFWRNALKEGININNIMHVEKEEKKEEKEEKKGEEKEPVGVFGPSADVLPPKNLKEAQRSPYWSGFREAIEKEITQLEKNNTWEYIEKRDLPTNANILKSKFVFDIKRGPGGNS